MPKPLLFFVCLCLVGCGTRPANTEDSGADTANDTLSADVASVDAPLDSAGPDAAREASTDATSDAGSDAASDVVNADTPSDGSTIPAYLARCQSFFAARIVELQIAQSRSFPADCDAPLTNPIALLRRGGDAMCLAGESANQCRTRIYRSPPNLTALDQACWTGNGPTNCMRASYVPRCSDGTDRCMEDEAVCQDGTRPMVYAEAATAGPSDVWLFHLGGEGGPCNGVKCWLNYRFGEPEFSGAMSTLHPDRPASAANRGSGILNGSMASPFARINRVRFERCTDAASDAIENAPIANGVPPEFASQYPGSPPATASSRVPVWHRGFNTFRATLHHFTTMAGRDRNGDGTPDLPSLANARMVLLSGSSDASMWVTLAADQLAAEVRMIAGPDVQVRVMVDGMFPPMLDEAARYHAMAPANFNMLSMPYRSTNLCQLPDNRDGMPNEACSNTTYATGGPLQSSYQTRGVHLDASCVAMHGANAPECYDRNHTLVHHLGVPVFILADQEDNTVSDSAPAWADNQAFLWGSPTNYRRIILDQAWDVVDAWSTRAREEGAGTAGNFVLVLPKARREGEPWGRATHVRFHDDAEMARGMSLCSSGGMQVANSSFAQMLSGWINGPLPQNFAIEDASHRLPNGSAWVTGAACRAPE